MKRTSLWVMAAALAYAAASSVLLSQVQAADPMDWPNWRGPEQNGTSREVGLVDSWDPATKKGELWRRDDVGTRSTPIVMNGKLYYLAASETGTPQEGERVLCLDAATGKTIWEQRFNVYLSDVPSERTAWGNVCGDPETGNVYALGVCGLFHCFDGTTGKVLWKHSLHEEFGLLSTYGGRTNSPIVFEDKVIISSIVIGWGDMARPAHRFLAFDKKTGEVIWFNGTRPIPYDTCYSTPTIAMLGKQLSMVFGSGDGWVWALQPRTGKQIWKYELSATSGLNISPLVDGDSVYTAQSEENRDDNTMGAVVAINGAAAGAPGGIEITKSGELWRKKEIVAGKSSPLMIDGRLYIVDDRAKLWIFDPKSGKQIGTAGTPNLALGTAMRASPLYADGKIYAVTLEGKYWVLQPTATGVKPIKQGRQDSIRLTQVAPGTECHGSIIASHGRIYIPTTEAIYCLGTKGKEPKIGERSAAVREPAAADDAAPAQVQVIPCEVVLQPGKTQSFRVKLYNAAGQFLKDSAAEFTLDGGGAITTEGKFTADANSARHQAAVITAKVGKVSGVARVRVIPPLPWKFDFSDGPVPLTWIGMRFRHVALDMAIHKELRDEDAKSDEDVKKRSKTAMVYEYLSFQAPGPTATFTDAAPARNWTGLRVYLFGTTAKDAATLTDAKTVLDPWLKSLAAKKIVSKWAWGGTEVAPILTVTRAPRPRGPAHAIYKLDDIPVPGGTTKLGTRSRGFVGPADLHDYTIEADVLGTVRPGRQIGDIGLFAQGYTFAVMGSNKRLQIHVWDPQIGVRASKWIDKFEIKPDTWYRMKFSAANEKDKVVLRGKIWERGGEEPADWMLTVEDAMPVRSGAPGFFGSAREPGSPFAIDNVVVKQNP